MKVMLLTLLLVTANASELSVPDVKELDYGASRGIEYSIKRETADPANVIIRLVNRGKRDIRLTYFIIPGSGDSQTEIQRTCIIKGDSAWPMRGAGKIPCTMNKPGIRIDNIETGVIEEEEGFYFDGNGNETQSIIYKFKPDTIKR